MSSRSLHSGSHTQQDHAKPHPGGPGTHIFVAAILTRQQSWSLTHLTTYFVCGTETSAKELLLIMVPDCACYGFADVFSLGMLGASRFLKSTLVPPPIMLSKTAACLSSVTSFVVVLV